MSMYYNYGCQQRQKGATLIVSLVILAVITIIGITSMRSSTLQLKMAASARDRAVAFQAVESALGIVEGSIQAANYQISDFLPTCQGDKCFRDTCDNGLCFTGDLIGAQSKSDCRITKTTGGANASDQSWKKESNWEDKAQAIKVLANTKTGDEAEYVSIDVNYLIEFLCFVPQDEKTILDENNPNGGVPLFRITARAQGEAKRSTVMLQSVYKSGKSN